MAEARPKVRLNLVRPSAANQALLNRARFEYRRGIHTMAHRRGIGIPNNLKGKTFQPLNTGREAFGFPPTRPGPIPEGTYPMAMPFVPAGPPRGPPAGPQRHMLPIPKTNEENSNNNEAFNVPLGPNPTLVLKGQLFVLKSNKEQIEAHIEEIEAQMRENERNPKRRRTPTSMNRVNGKTYTELQDTLNELQEELKIVEGEIERLEMRIGEEEFIARQRMQSVATASTRKGGRRHRSTRRRRPAHRRKPRA